VRNQPTRRRPVLRRWGGRRWHGRHWHRGLRLGTVALAAALGITVTTALEGASSRIDALGPQRDVWIATRALEPGRTVQADDARLVAVPAGAVAPSALGPDADVTGRTVHARIESGEGIVEARLAPPDLVGVAARTPAGRRALAVPLDERAPPLVPGQRVDLYTGAPGGDVASASGGDTTGRRIAADAVVVDVDERRATVAVSNEDAAAVAAALIERTIIVAVSGPDGGREG
jgi:Flp pilus assembly protein CpaB